MRQLFLVLLFDLCVVVYFTSAGILDSFLSGLHSSSDDEPSNNKPSSVHSNDQVAIAASNNNKWHTNSSSFYLPIDDGGQLRVDLCEGDILVPLSFDGKNEVIVKSTNFPFKRSTPLICSWNVKVTKNCWRGMVTMKINGYSRLADLGGCLHGYYTVSPFMNDTKICGRINEVPEFQWYVENQQPENVTIILRHAGLNDGFAEGLGFTLSGECLPNSSELTLEKSSESHITWLQQLSMKQSTPEGGPTVFTPSEVDLLHPANVTSDESTTIPPTTLSPISEIGTTAVTASMSQDLQTSSVEPPVLQSNTSSNINQSLVDSHPENVTVPVKLSMDSNNVTEIPPAVLQSTTAVPINKTSAGDPAEVLDNNSPLSNKTLVLSLSTTEKPINLPPAQPTNNVSSGTTKRPSSSVYISNDNPDDIPWLILNAPEDELLPEYYPSSILNSPLELSKPEAPQQSLKPIPSVSQQVPAEYDPLPNKSHSSVEVETPLRNNQVNISTDYSAEPPTTNNLQSPVGHRDQLVLNKKRPPANANSTSIAPEVILIDVVLKSPNRVRKPLPNRYQNISSANGSVKIPPVRSPVHSNKMSSSSLSSKRRPAATTIKASNSNRPNFYKPPRRNPLLTFDD